MRLIRPFLFAGLFLALGAAVSPSAQSASVFWDQIAKAHVENTAARWQAFETSCGTRHDCQGIQAEALALVQRERLRLNHDRLDSKAVNAVADFLAGRMPYVDEGSRYVDFDGIEALKRGRGVCWVYALAAYGLLQAIEPGAKIEFRLAKPDGDVANHAYIHVWADGIEYDLEQANPTAVWAAQSAMKNVPVYLAVANRRPNPPNP